MLFLHTLGELRLIGPDGDVLAGRRKDLALLAYLASRAPRAVPRAQLAALLWDERAERSARHSLRQVLLRLKRALDGGLKVGPEHVELASGVEIDTSVFDADLAAGRVREAVACYGGDFMAGVEDVGGEEYRLWVEGERARLRNDLANALERLIAGAEERGAWDEAVRWGEQWTDALPLDERAHTRLVKALRLDDRAREALTRHAAFLERFRSALDTLPSPELLRLQQDLERSVHAELARPPTPGSAALFTPDLVGRGAAFSELVAAWGTACEGAPVTVLVEGEEGIGKTRLCEEFLRWLTVRGQPQLVLRARANESERDAPWTAARALLAGIVDAPGLLGATADALAELAILVPGVRATIPGLPSASADERALCEAVARVLADVASEVPVALFLDDVSSADLASQRLMLSLAHRPPNAGLLLLLAARPSELGRTSVLSELHATRGVRQLKLQPLSAGEVEALLASMLELPLGERHELATRLHDAGGGNPFYATEIVSALVDEGHLTPDVAGEWKLSPALMGGRLPLPTGVRDAIARRLARLSGVAQEAVGAAVALGNTFDPVLLSATTERPVEALVEAVEELISRRLVRAALPPRIGYEFAHESIRRVARDVLPPGWHGPAQHGDARTIPAGRTPPDADATNGKGRWRIRRWSVLTTGIAILGITAAIYRSHNPPQAPTPVLAIGSVRAYGGADTSGTASAIADMLATNLSRVPSVRVVSPARMYELLGRLGGAGDGKAAMARAARQAGATELVEGALYRRESGLRLDLRRVDLATGDVKQAYAAEGTDAFMLVDRATSELAAALGAPMEQLRIADVTTKSLAAYRLYQEGLRAYYRSADFAGADRLFTAALAEDSTFAMTAYYAYLMELASGVPGGWRHLAIAARMADRASDRERLLIRFTWTSEEGNPAYVAVAETLVTRYPTDPEGYLILGRVLSGKGDVVGAIKMFRHVLVMDTLPLETSSARCLACEAMYGIVDSYWWADSLPAAERAAREWVRRQPAAPAAWSNLSARLGSQGKYPEALAALRTASRLAPADVDDVTLRAELALTVGDFAEADRLLRDRIRNGTPATRDRAAWDLDISFRNQGRLRNALALAGGTLSQAEDDGPTLVTAPLPELVRAQVLFEMGRTREAATLFQSIAASPLDSMPAGRIARHGSWYLTHAATALAAAGDTGRLAALADTIQTIGERSTYGRDPLLHHHVRGLLFAARRKPDDAVAEFRRAMYSPTLGFTRTNLELGRGLIALGRPREAIASLAPALRGGLEGSNLYVTRTELHEMLARAFDAAADPDSATVHYQAVLSAWRRADPQFRARYDAARLRLARLTALRATPRAERL